WRSEESEGREEGAKDRPCAVVMTAKRASGATVVTVAPITHSPPQHSENALEIPLITKKRLGLDDARSWVIVNEVNRFVWPGPDLRPISRHEPDRFAYGFFPPSFYDQLAQRIAACAKDQKLKIVYRTE
ncbi:MAG: hypothetical protein ACLP4V_29290, partial [Methylocella sp.]